MEPSSTPALPSQVAAGAGGGSQCADTEGPHRTHLQKHLQKQLVIIYMLSAAECAFMVRAE